MSQQETRKVWVQGVYNWPVSITKEERHKNKNYQRHNWVDIDTRDLKYYESVIDIFKRNNVSCIGQLCGKGAHVWGDLVPFDTWLHIWTQIKPYADPRWAPHTLRISKKSITERWERPVFYNFSNLEKPRPWMQSLMSYICKALREENSSNLKSAVHQVGLDKYFECPRYIVELK